jgi:hypothetical protein
MFFHGIFFSLLSFLAAAAFDFGRRLVVPAGGGVDLTTPAPTLTSDVAPVSDPVKANVVAPLLTDPSLRRSLIPLPLVFKVKPGQGYLVSITDVSYVKTLLTGFASAWLHQSATDPIRVSLTGTYASASATQWSATLAIAIVSVDFKAPTSLGEVLGCPGAVMVTASNITSTSAHLFYEEGLNMDLIMPSPIGLPKFALAIYMVGQISDASLVVQTSLHRQGYKWTAVAPTAFTT